LTPNEIRGLEAAVAASDALIREILEALCRRDGLTLDSSVVPGEPARNYDLAMRLGIGHVFGIRDPEEIALWLPDGHALSAGSC
jgi:hypothetical protein